MNNNNYYEGLCCMRLWQLSQAMTTTQDWKLPRAIYYSTDMTFPYYIPPPCKDDNPHLISVTACIIEKS